MFKGFNIVYPEYEIITPQTNLSFTVRSMNVQEEERLKASLITPQKITEHLNKCLFELMVKKPDEITDFKSFLEKITLKDRDGILYGIYHVTYEEIRNYDVRCSSCSKEYPVTIKASDTFKFNPYPSNDILEKRIKVALPKSNGVFAIIKQPTLLDEIEAIKKLSGTPGYTMDIIAETLIIDRFEQDIEAIVDPIIINDKADIIDAYRTLAAKDKRSIYDSYSENFGKYNIELKMKTYCQHCGTEDIVDIDLFANFFRMVQSS